MYSAYIFSQLLVFKWPKILVFAQADQVSVPLETCRHRRWHGHGRQLELLHPRWSCRQWWKKWSRQTRECDAVSGWLVRVMVVRIKWFGKRTWTKKKIYFNKTLKLNSSLTKPTFRYQLELDIDVYKNNISF